MHIFSQCNKKNFSIDCLIIYLVIFYAETELLLIILAQMDTFQH